MRILICDKDRKVHIRLKNRLTELYSSFARDEEIMIATFESLFELEDYIEKKRMIVDAVFMDVGNEKESSVGLTSARKIKELYPDIYLVLYAESMECVEDIFEINPLWFLLKKSMEQKLDKVMKRLLEIVRSDKYIMVKKVGGVRRINEDDIYYIESRGRYIYIHLKDGYVTFIGKIDDVTQKLSQDFIRCHQSYVVNGRKVKECDYINIKLINNKVIDISRSYRTKIKDIFKA